MPRFLVETYMSRAASGDLQAAVARARLAAAALSREGRPTRFVRSFFLPEDEVWFCLYEARSLEEVIEAGHLAELQVDRIQHAIELESGPQQTRQPRAPQPGERASDDEQT